MAKGRRFLGTLPALTRKSWESVAQPLEDFLRKIWASESDGVPAGFNDEMPTEVLAPIGTGLGDPGNQIEGWAAADHRHVAGVDAPVPVGVEEDPGEGTSTALSRGDHRHELKSYRTVGLTVDGSTAVVTTGVKGMIAVPFTGRIVGWKLESSQPGNAVVDAWRSRRKPNSGDSICGGSLPTLSGSVSATGSPVGWETGIEAGDIFAFNVVSTNLTLLTLTLKVREGSLGF